MATGWWTPYPLPQNTGRIIFCRKIFQRVSVLTMTDEPFPLKAPTEAVKASTEEVNASNEDLVADAESVKAASEDSKRSSSSSSSSDSDAKEDKKSLSSRKSKNLPFLCKYHT